MPRKILHLITSLNLGGAETMLCQILEHTNRAHFTPVVVSLRPESALSARVREAGVTLYHLDMSGWRSAIQGWRKLKSILRKERPVLVQSWMYHANLLGSLALAGSADRPRLVWNIQHGDMPRGSAKLLSQLLRRALAFVSSRSPDGIIVCARASIEEHARVGYAREKMTHIPNGVNCFQFAPNPTVRAEVRKELELPNDVPVIGIAARYNPQKDYATFFAAVSKLQQTHPQVHFVACGSEITDANPELMRKKLSCAHPDQIHLLGPRKDMYRILNAWDIATLSSVCGEAHPVSLCEALATGLPCVATTAGDSGAIIGPAGYVGPLKDAGALADGWRKILDARKAVVDDLRTTARARALERFALPEVAGKYESLYLELLEQRDRRPVPADEIIPQIG